MKAFDLAQDGEARSPQILLQLQCSAIYATEVAAEVCRTLFGTAARRRCMSATRWSSACGTSTRPLSTA